MGSQLTLTYDRKRIILERNAKSEDLGGKYVDVYDFPEGRLEVRSKGLLLPYSVFSKDQRVSHTAKGKYCRRLVQHQSDTFRAQSLPGLSQAVR